MRFILSAHNTYTTTPFHRDSKTSEAIKNHAKKRIRRESCKESVRESKRFRIKLIVNEANFVHQFCFRHTLVVKLVFCTYSIRGQTKQVSQLFPSH